jgi:hypothetical protein
MSAKVFGPLADILHTGATLKELLHASPARSYAKGTSGVTFVGANKRDPLYHITYRAWGKEKTSDPRGHLVKMRFLLDPEVKPEDMDVEVSCDCYAFVYWGAQYNIKQRNALEREIPGKDGVVDLSAPEPVQPPKQPRDFVVCKHIADVVTRASQLIERHLKKAQDSMKKKEPVVPPGTPPEPPSDEQPPVTGAS